MGAAGTGMSPNEYMERFVRDGKQAVAREVDGDDTERTAKAERELERQRELTVGTRVRLVNTATQEMIDERERQASWQRHRWLKDRAKNREPRPPEPMSADTSLPSNFDSWSHVFAVKGLNRAHTHAQGPNAVNEYVQGINELLETEVGAASDDSTFQLTDKNGCSLVPASVLAEGAGMDKSLFGDDGNLIRYARAEHLARTNESLPTGLIPAARGEEDEMLQIDPADFPTTEEQREAGEQWEASQAGNFENGPETWSDSDWDEFNVTTSAREAAVDVLEQLADSGASADLSSLPVTDFDPR